MQDVYHGCDGSRLSFYHRITVFVYHGLRLSFFISIYSTMPLESSLILLLATAILSLNANYVPARTVNEYCTIHTFPHGE